MKPKIHIPPKRAEKLLKWFLREDIAEEVLGDLDEKFYATIERKSIQRAQLNYWYQVINYLRPFAIRKSKLTNLNHYAMFKHNFKLTYRSFLRDKSAFFINLFGLSTGLAGALLIYLWVNSELKVDKFYENDQQLYQLMENRESADGIFTTNSTPWLLAETIAEEIPEIQSATVATPTFWHEKSTLQVGENVTKAQGHFVGEDYFRVFSYKITQGDKNTVLKDKSSIVISEELASRLFNTTDNIIGRAITYQQESDYLISGVFKDISSQSSTQFDFALSVEILKDTQPQAFAWENAGPNTFIVLNEDVNPNLFQDKISAFITTKTEDEHRKLLLTRYSDNYLHGRFENGISVGGKIEYIQLFSVIAIFILMIACINFMNLSTARVSKRTKEIGVKKSMGVSRSALILQYLTESIVLSSLALIVAVIAVILILPHFNQIIGKVLTFDPDLWLITTLCTIALITGLLAGSYPALHLSGLKPVSIIKGNLQNSFGELWTRKGLVVFQFTLSVMFIVFVSVVYKQIEFVQNKNLGYNKDNVIHFEIEGNLKNNLETFLSELKKLPGVVNSSSAGQSMVGGGNTSNIGWEGKDPELIRPFAFRPANYGLLELLDLEVIQGRSFSRDYADNETVIFNEAGIKAMGLTDPIGKTVDLGDIKSKIIGVVQDFHYESLRKGVNPMFFILAPPHTEKVMARIESVNANKTLESIEQLYQQFNPGFTFSYRFLDDDYQAQYRAEQQVATLSQYFAGLAIIISCLGLFGLATFTAEKRLKEIGIRKVLGAGSLRIVALLTTDFTKMVLFAIGIALPISYFIAAGWLESFVFRITLSWWFFVGAGSLVVFIAWVTVSIKTFKVANINPVECLKQE